MAKKTTQPLENLDAALSDVPSNAHAGEPDPEAVEKFMERANALAEATTPTKKPRTASPETLALRAHQKRRELQELISGEIDRHATRLGGLQERLREHDADCEKLPEAVKKILAKLRGDL